MSYADSYHYRYHHVPLEHLCLCQTQGLPSGSPIKWLSLTIQQLCADSVRWVVVALEVLRRDDAQRGVGPLQNWCEIGSFNRLNRVALLIVS
jgi:hypothetical protein